MSHFPADKMGFYDAVQLFFMELTGRAIMFSGRDLELLSQWRAEGATVAVICKGIEEAVRAMDPSDPPRNIYGCRQYISPLVEQARKKAAGRHGAASRKDGEDGEPPERSVVAHALAAVEQAGKQAGREEIRRVYRDVWRRLKAVRDDDGEAFEAVAAVEQALAEGYFAALAESERAAIEARMAAEIAGLSVLSEEARHDHVLARRRLLLIRDYGMATLWT
jgi:hypothetical protein